MTDGSDRCLTPEQIAAFVAGSLKGEELTTVTNHLRDCEDCRAMLAAAASIDREAEAPAQPLRRSARRRSRWWIAAAAAVVMGIAYVAIWPIASRTRNDAIQQLAEAAPRDGRYLEPRLSGGFPWAPMRIVRRDESEPLEPPQMKLIGAAGEVLERTANDPSPEARHATALAHLIAGRPTEAASVLQKLSSSDDPHVWSDLAAARYAAGVRFNQPAEFAEALAAADKALRLAPELPEALFNRALTIERLGMSERARAAWKQYLAIDGKSSWAREARTHLERLAAGSAFLDEFQRDYQKLLRDPRQARDLARRFPQDARLRGETEILGRWAEARRAGRGEEAEDELRLARTFGETIAGTSGDLMLKDAVTSIDRASPDARAILAEGHVHFRDAQKLFRAGSWADALPRFEQAAELFARGGSPAGLLARNFAANALYDLGRIPESRRRIEPLLASAPLQYPAHRAQVQWQMGLVQAAGGQWGAAIDAFDDSIRIFDRLGERRDSAIVSEILSEVYDRIGDSQSAWKHRHIAFQELGRTEDRRLHTAIQAAARAAALERDWAVSLSFLDLVLNMPRPASTQLQYFETLLFRARVRGKMGQHGPAVADLQSAASAMKVLTDPAMRERAEADRLAVAGFLADSPADAISNFTRSIEFHRVKGRRMFLPEMYLERGRAYAAFRGKEDLAVADFEAGVHELEEQRLSLRAGDERWRMFSSFGELFDEAMTHALARGERERAFTYSERARARELLDSMGEDSPALMAATSAASLPASMQNVVLIEYASLPMTLVTFVVDREGLRVLQAPIPRTTLSGEVDGLTASAMARDTARFRSAAATLYGRLLLPVASSLCSECRVVIVPDATLSTVPFAALVDPAGKYVVEQNLVIVAPSASVFAHLLGHPWTPRRDLQLLLIAGPAGSEGNVRQLTSSQREAVAVTGAYRRAADVLRGDGSGATFEARAASADIIHFVGHADPAGGGRDGALVTPSGRLDVRSIAALHLRRTRVVVLAACGTASGQRRAGHENISLARAFLAAGAPSVVATLWPIDDDPAADFFPRLHHYLADGMAPAEAVRATQLEWIHRRDAPPGLWAAVQSIGS
jgi:CHAT domain-containing protein